MKRVKVDSSSIHSIGWDETGTEAQFHAKDCAGATWKPTGPEDKMKPGLCNCDGGTVYHYPGVPEQLHKDVMGAKSVGSAFAVRIKGAQHPTTGALLYPHVKRGA